jgi:glycosyltransferase involved in cell wall biosynthesis
MAVKECEKLGKSYMLELVGCPWDGYWNHSIKGKIIAPFIKHTTARNVYKAPFVVYVTNEFLQNRYPTKGKSVNCSNVFITEYDGSLLERSLNRIRKSEKLILGTAAGVNVRFKGQQYVIKAIGELKKQGVDNIEYQLVGAGDQTYLKTVAENNGIADKVKFLGSLPHEKVFQWLDTINIYVQPSRQEGLPRSVIEAMSRGLPCFGAKTGGIPELLEPEYIFSNTNNNIKEISLILKGYTKDRMEAQAIRNFQEAKQYLYENIEARRRPFYGEYAQSIGVEK